MKDASGKTPAPKNKNELFWAMEKNKWF